MTDLVTIMFRFGSLVPFVILLAFSFAHYRDATSPAMRRVRIAIPLLWGVLVITQVAAVFTRADALYGWDTPAADAVPLVIAVLTFIVAIANLWAFWPGRRNDDAV